MKETKLKILGVEFVRTKSDKVRARADVHFEGFWLKGFKVIQDKESKKDYVVPPSYQSPKGWRVLFRTDSREDWQEIQRRILEEFNLYEMRETADEVSEESEN